MSDLQDPNEPEFGKPKKPQRPLWQQIAYNAMPLILLAVAAAFVMPMVQDMMNPTPRRLTPLRGQPQPPVMARPGAPITTPAPDSPASDAAPNAAASSAPIGPRAEASLVNAFGDGAIGQAARDARRYAALGVLVARCNTRDAAWLATLREAVGPDIARRFNSYDGKPEDSLRLQGFVVAQYSAAYAAGTAWPVQLDCAELPTVPEFRSADTLVRTWRATRRQ